MCLLTRNQVPSFLTAHNRLYLCHQHPALQSEALLQLLLSNGSIFLVQLMKELRMLTSICSSTFSCLSWRLECPFSSGSSTFEGIRSRLWIAPSLRSSSSSSFSTLPLPETSSTYSSESNLFNIRCRNIDGVSRLVQDLDIKCYSGDHLLWAVIGGGLGLVFWVIGIPWVAWTLLH